MQSLSSHAKLQSDTSAYSSADNNIEQSSRLSLKVYVVCSARAAKLRVVEVKAM